MTAADRQEFLKRQREMCVEKKAPFFMPSSGYCDRCHKDIIEDEVKAGNNGSGLVTGCPYCGRSYCE